MARTHGQLFANQTLRQAVFADPLAFLRAVATGEPAAAAWEAAGRELGPAARIRYTGSTATVEPRGRYAIAVIAPPPPRAPGDPALIAVVGRGDGIAKISTLAYYVLEVANASRFDIVSVTPEGVRARLGDGPLPDARWFADHAFALYSGNQPAPSQGTPELPSWWWWLAFDGARALHGFGEAPDDARRDLLTATPVLLLPDIVDSAEAYGPDLAARRLRELRDQLARDPATAPLWYGIVERLASTTTGSQPANILRALTLIADLVRRGALTAGHGFELEAATRSKLVALGVDAPRNQALVEQLYAAARAAAEAPRVARGTLPPPPPTGDAVWWDPLFLDETDLPTCARAHREDAPHDPAFAALGGLRAAHTSWYGSERSALAQVLDSRWVFRSSSEALHFLRTMPFGDGLTPLSAPQLGDNTLAFGDDGMTGARRSQVLVLRVGRVVARLQAVEGAHAAQEREMLHAALLHPIAGRMVLRARKALASYWIAVAYPTNAVAALVHSPGYDAARLLAQYPLLAHAELPAAMAQLGDDYAAPARALASFQAQIRAHRWSSYRDAMLALVHSLLACDVGDPRVNAAHALEIVAELRPIDPDPIWFHLDGECRARC